MHAVEGNDFLLSSNVYTARADAPAEIIVTYRVDSIAQEFMETVRLRLSFNQDPPTGTIAQDMLDLVITDSDGN